MDTKDKYLFKEIRLKTGLTQKAFAYQYNIPLATLKKWEQNICAPSPYFMDLLLKTLPFSNDILIKINKDDKVYYLDKTNHIAFDSLGNSIKFNESIDGVNENNLFFYLDDLFTSFYEIQGKFNRDLKLDRIEGIEWK